MSIREEWLNMAVAEVRPVFDAVGFPLPQNIRVTCGFPSKGGRSVKKAIGEHWSSKASDDSHHEISISPVVSDGMEVFGILVHELAHSATDGDGHRGRFPSCVKALMLEGKPTSTVVGQKFKDYFYDLVDSLGKYPHATLNVGTGKKTQGTRMLKASCPHCGYVVRLTKTWADMGLPACPVDNVPFEL